VNCNLKKGAPIHNTAYSTQVVQVEMLAPSKGLLMKKMLCEL